MTFTGTTQRKLRVTQCNFGLQLLIGKGHWRNPSAPESDLSNDLAPSVNEVFNSPSVELRVLGAKKF